MQHSDDEHQGRQAPAPAPQARGGGLEHAGAPPCNTAPASSTAGSPVRILRAGVDSLYLSYAGQLRLDLWNQLKALKEFAQSTVPLEQASAVLELAGHRFEVRDRGTRRFPFVLVDNPYFISVKGFGAVQLPLAISQISSEWLLAKGVETACRDLHEVILELGEVESGSPLVSRADLYCDFTCDLPLAGLPWSAFVTRARQKTAYAEGDTSTGYTVGLGGDISARLYDKSREIEISCKPYWQDAWIEGGWWSGQVWRLEFQLRRRVLAEHGIDTVSTLLANLRPLWRYCTESWLRLTVPSETDATQSRWPLHPVWQALTEAHFEGSQDGLSHPVRSDRPPSDEYLFLNGLNGITSYMAREGITDPKEAFDRYYEDARQFHMGRHLAVGIDFVGYLREKAALKARGYNKTYPGVDERQAELLRKAAADAYRKAKDGE